MWFLFSRRKFLIKIRAHGRQWSKNSLYCSSEQQKSHWCFSAKRLWIHHWWTAWKVSYQIEYRCIMWIRLKMDELWRESMLWEIVPHFLVSNSIKLCSISRNLTSQNTAQQMRVWGNTTKFRVSCLHQSRFACQCFQWFSAQIRTHFDRNSDTIRRLAILIRKESIRFNWMLKDQIHPLERCVSAHSKTHLVAKL